MVSGSGKQKHCCPNPTISADMLNTHYAGISTDNTYTTPNRKFSPDEFHAWVSEFEVFVILDSVRATSSGLDGTHHWFLRIGAPFLYQPVAFLCNHLISFSFKPPQWKSSIITPVPKTKQLTDCADFRPISVTSILCRLIEKLVIRKFFHPILTHANFKNLFNDQFAFRPSGSTTAALINLLQKISLLLEEHKYVHLIGLDFSKAFDSVCHSTLIEKITPFPIPSNVHNWLVEYLNTRQHCTKYNSVISTMLQINASFVQGSRIGPIAYVLNTSDLHPVFPENSFNKYADDTYMVVPASNSHTIDLEMRHVSEWAQSNNLRLNTTKSVELIIHRPWVKLDKLSVPPPSLGLTRKTTTKILGVIITDTLSFSAHINDVIARCAQASYALRILRAEWPSTLECHEINPDIQTAVCLSSVVWLSG